MDYETITVGVEGAVGTLALDNPAKLNPLSVACLRELAEARSLGFVTRVVPPAELDSAVAELARALAAKSAYTLRATLRAVDAAAEALVPTGGAWNDADSLAAARLDPESREAARRYLETLGR